MSFDPASADTVSPEGTGGFLRWGIKSSFVRYVDSSPDGARTADGVAELPGEDGPDFEFPQSGVLCGVPEGNLVLEFSGSLRFRAHGGMLDVEFTAPSVAFRDGWADVSIADTASAGGRRVRIARFASEVPAAVAGRLSLQSQEVFLTTQGSQLLGDAYAARTLLAPLVVDVQTGESSE